jgi:hypothetical protein
MSMLYCWCDSDIGLLCRVYLHDHDVTRRVIVYLNLIAYVQAIVSSPLDIRRSLEKNINRVIPLELVDDTPLAKRTRKHMLVELRLVC